MKTLYARLVLFLIRPAIERALHEKPQQGEATRTMKGVVSAGDGSWSFERDGSLHFPAIELQRQVTRAVQEVIRRERGGGR
ncbi:hypothetical protein [Burkholderia gladioli]|uniref:hypothetical protein n=1 Tax=Burkholderia gladioli TaxID=28095 RepID=UPI00163FFDBA|nr:hypothetical protein [Burkholderia gladioli]